jgi:hypothetical protein
METFTLTPQDARITPPKFGQRCFVYYEFRDRGWLNASYEQGFAGETPVWVDGGGMRHPAGMFHFWVPEPPRPKLAKLEARRRARHYKKATATKTNLDA